MTPAKPGNNTANGNGKAMFTPFDAGGPGDMFVASPQWKAIADPSSRGQSWTTGPVDVGMLTKAGTLLESGQGAGAVPVPQVVPGLVPTLFQPLGIADIFQQGIATTSSIRYVNEGTATSGAAGVAEGATKPASDIAVATHRERRLTTRKVRRHYTLLISDFRGFGRREPGYWRYPVAPLLGPPRCAFIVPALRGSGTYRSAVSGSATQRKAAVGTKRDWPTAARGSHAARAGSGIQPCDTG